MAGSATFKLAPEISADVAAVCRMSKPSVGMPAGSPDRAGLRPSQVPVSGAAAALAGPPFSGEFSGMLARGPNQAGLRPSQVPVSGAAAALAGPPFPGGRWTHRGQQPRRKSAPERSVRDLLPGLGQPLTATVKEEMEGRFGADFSDVRVHTGAAARAAAAAINARAFTVGSHIVVGDDGKRTLVHELSHVIQQRTGLVSGSDRGNGLRLSDPSDPFERAAESNAARVMSGSAFLSQATPRTGMGEAREPGAFIRMPGGYGEVIQRLRDLSDDQWEGQATVLAAELERPDGWLRETPVFTSGGGLHAEERLIRGLTVDVAHDILPAGHYGLLININRSPCSELLPDNHGCAEKLIELATYGLGGDPGIPVRTFDITIIARHLYGSTNEERAMSALAVQMMRNHGIRVALNPAFFDVGTAKILSNIEGGPPVIGGPYGVAAGGPQAPINVLTRIPPPVLVLLIAAILAGGWSLFG
jgi:Domain of unknown function (DUF4157)